MPAKTDKNNGRATPKKNPRQQSGRYTQPIAIETRHSPRWYPYVLLVLLFAGVLVIIFNYLGIMPSSPANWYTLGGLVGILTAALLATNYR